MNPTEYSCDLITERARVLRVASDTVWVQCESQAGCARCAAGQGCGAGLFARLLRRRLEELPVNLPPTLPRSLVAGDVVLLGLSVAAVQNASVLLYGLPLAGLLAGALGGALVEPGDFAALVGSAAGLGGGLWLARRLGQRSGPSAGWQPVLLRVLDEHEPCSRRDEA